MDEDFFQYVGDDIYKLLSVQDIDLLILRGGNPP